jgi:K+ transporter
MGHVGRSPIRIAWYCIVLPALVLNYAGQVGKFMDAPDLESNPFFKLAPDWTLYPLIGLATVATIIASQGHHYGIFAPIDIPLFREDRYCVGRVVNSSPICCRAHFPATGN